MKSSSSRTTPWVLGGSVAIAAILCVPLIAPFISTPAVESPPGQVRPWATEQFIELTAPVPSPGSPSDPKYAARHGGSFKPSDRNYAVSVVIEPARIPFVPNYEVIEFGSAEGFSSPSGKGKVRWLAGKAYDLPPNGSDIGYSSELNAFHPDGSPMSGEEERALGIPRRELNSWGLEQEGVGGTAMIVNLGLQGFPNLQYHLRGVFDATTHVSFNQWFFLNQTPGGLRLFGGLAVLHNAPLLAVIDLAHGETQDVLLPLAKGARHNHADFSIEVIEIHPGTTSGVGREPSGIGRELSYGFRGSSPAADSFSVIYQINPPSMAAAVSVDAIDLSGKPIEADDPFSDAAPVRSFKAPLASCSSLQIRYRPHLTRLLLKLKATPGVDSSNRDPADLFDVRAPTITFRNPRQLRRFISDATQLKDVTGSHYDTTLGTFPMTLINVSPRQALERYLAIDPRHRAKVDPAALTIEFEQPPKSTWLSNTLDRIKRLAGYP